MKRIVYSLKARQDLKAIYWFIRRDNQHAASRVVKRIGSSIEGLASFSTGRPSRVAGAFEKVVVGLPYIVITSWPTAK